PEIYTLSLHDALPIYLQQAAQNVARSGTELAAAAVDRVLDAVAAVPTISLVLALAVVATFFFAKDRYVVHSVLVQALPARVREVDRKSTRLNSSHVKI